MSGGRAFHAEGTANVKVLRQDVLQLQGIGPGSGWKGVGEAERVIGVEIKRKYFAKGSQSISFVIRKRQNKITVKYHFTYNNNLEKAKQKCWQECGEFCASLVGM